jgi:PLP dependent protein
MNVEKLRSNLSNVRERIAAAAARSGREASAVTLVSVTKRMPMKPIRALFELGEREFGENYPQHLWGRVEALSALAIRWHLIGHLQVNKAKKTLGMVRLVHSVDSLKLLQAIDALAAEMDEPPGVCLQVNASGESAKHGWLPEAIAADAEAIAACRQVPIVGLMTMAAFGTTAETARPTFALLRSTRDVLRARTGLALDQLSMGMSNDFETAVEEGATLVRVGSALFEGVGS